MKRRTITVELEVEGRRADPDYLLSWLRSQGGIVTAELASERSRTTRRGNVMQRCLHCHFNFADLAGHVLRMHPAMVETERA